MAALPGRPPQPTLCPRHRAHGPQGELGQPPQSCTSTGSGRRAFPGQDLEDTEGQHLGGSPGVPSKD